MQNLYTLITRRHASGLMIDTGNAVEDLLDVSADRLPFEYSQEAWEERCRAFDAYAQPGHIVTGIDYAIVCEHRSPAASPKTRDQIEVARPKAGARRLFAFANGCEIDVDRYLGLDACARDHAAHFQMPHGAFLRVYFDSDEQRGAELARMRAFRDGAP